PCAETLYLTRFDPNSGSNPIIDGEGSPMKAGISIPITARSRSALIYCTEWGAGCRGAQQLSFCCHDTGPALEEWCCARRRPMSEHPVGSARHVRFVAARRATVTRLGVLLPRSNPAAPERPRIPWRFAVRARYPA